MRQARVYVHDREAGILTEVEEGRRYRFDYLEAYEGEPVSLTMPVEGRAFEYDRFPPFFDGVLPEGFQLEHLLRMRKLDRDDHFGQLVTVGHELVGAVTVEEIG